MVILVSIRNQENDYRGRFWKGGFCPQRLLDENALLAWVDVDLNPVRAGLADRPETRYFALIQQRLQQYPSARTGNPFRFARVPVDPGTTR